MLEEVEERARVVDAVHVVLVPVVLLPCPGEELAQVVCVVRPLNLGGLSVRSGMTSHHSSLG
jgi:hypothetical protein